MSLTNESPAALRCWQSLMKEFISPIGFPASPATQLHVSPTMVACKHSRTAQTFMYKEELLVTSTPPLRVPFLCVFSLVVLFNSSPTPHVGSLPLFFPLLVSPRIPPPFAPICEQHLAVCRCKAAGKLSASVFFT